MRKLTEKELKVWVKEWILTAMRNPEGREAFAENSAALLEFALTEECVDQLQGVITGIVEFALKREETDPAQR